MKLFFLIAVVFVIILSSASVVAQIDSGAIVSSGAVCGNGKRELLEPCDLSSKQEDNDLCSQIGKSAGIAMVCRAELCYCLPRKYIVCGDKHTTGNEMCDAGDKDFCPTVSNLTGAPLECNTKSCLCKPSGDFFLGLSSKKSEEPANLSKSSCGNRDLDAGEECDPPGRMCTYKTKVGVCSDACVCEELKDDDDAGVVENSTVVNGSVVVQSNSSNETVAPVVEQKPDVVEPESGSLSEALAKTGEDDSDSAYTVLLIVLVVVFVAALAVGSFFIYRKSQIGNFSTPSDSDDGPVVDDQGRRIQ